jgi:hypothetical protein
VTQVFNISKGKTRQPNLARLVQSGKMMGFHGALSGGDVGGDVGGGGGSWRWLTVVVGGGRY